MKIGTTYPSFNYDIRASFKTALGSSVEVKLMTTYDDLKECDLVAFPGGEDVNPNMYSQNNTHSHGVNNNRDEREKFFFRHARELGKPMFGMCRGLQFIAVMLGFELIQDIYLELEMRHGGGHPLEKVVDSIVSKNFSSVNSLHHQGVFADTDINLLRRYKDRGVYVTSMYNNVVESFESDKIMVTQFHPEFMHSKESNNFFTDLGEWIEKPQYTFNMDEYNNIMRFTPKVTREDYFSSEVPEVYREATSVRMASSGSSRDVWWTASPAYTITTDPEGPEEEPIEEEPIEEEIEDEDEDSN